MLVNSTFPGFFINLPIGGIGAILLLFTHVPEVNKKKPFSMSLIREVIPKLDLFGFVLFAPAAIMLLLALQLGSDNSHTWNSSVIIGLLCGAGVLAIIFGIWEHRVGDTAMIPGSLVSKRIVWASLGQAAFLAITLYVSSAFLPIYFQAVKGVGPTMSGVYSLPSILSQLSFIIISGASGTSIMARTL